MQADVIRLSKMEIKLTVNEIQDLFDKGDLTKEKLQNMYEHAQDALLTYKQSIEGELE